jgi:16S rRNA (guanine527-N7)-methyltransferase
MFHVERKQNDPEEPPVTDLRGTRDHEPVLRRYAELVRLSPHNLLSRQGLTELETRHIPESVRFAAALPRASELLDLGSGGGLPGMVIAIVRPDIHVHLLDATRKKTEFLRETAVALGIEVTVHNGRAEEMAGGDLRHRFPIVTARALARLSTLVDLALPYLAPGGTLYAIKGGRWQEELEEVSSLELEVVSTPELVPLSGPDGPIVVAMRRAQ